MNPSLVDLARQRGELVQRARAERETLIAVMEERRGMFEVATMGMTALRVAAAHKLLVAVAAAGFAMSRPRLIARWLSRAVKLYQFWTKIRAMIT